MHFLFIFNHVDGKLVGIKFGLSNTKKVTAEPRQHDVLTRISGPVTLPLDVASQLAFRFSPTRKNYIKRGYLNKQQVIYIV